MTTMLEAKTITKEEYERLVSGTSFPDTANMPLDNGIRKSTAIHSEIQNVLPKAKGKMPVKVGILTNEEYQKLSSHHTVVYTTSPIAAGHIARAIRAHQKDISSKS